MVVKRHKYSLYTKEDLRLIHRGFRHASMVTKYQLFNRATTDNLQEGILKERYKIREDYNMCVRNVAKPRRLRIKNSTGRLQFNHRVIVDTIFINNKSMIHLVDESAHFTAVRFLNN